MVRTAGIVGSADEELLVCRLCTRRIMKDKIYKAALGLYFKCEKIPVLSTLNILGYRAIACMSNPNSRRLHGDKTDKLPPVDSAHSIAKIRMAMIADQMTFDCFSSACDCVALTCHDWLNQMKAHRPHIFFCESAWIGNDKDGHCWRGQIYKNKTFFVENRKTVLQILDFCQHNGIPTVFYNKEDPTSFDDPYHNFVDLALRFDYVYTTAAECVEKYKALGAKFCACMQMGVSLKLYNPLREPGQVGKGAVFAGSWYAEFEKRCADMQALFDQMLQSGIGLTIYDRYFSDNNPQKQFPGKYKDCIRPAIPFHKLGQTLKNYEYALNINTVTDSSTMFARRVFEVMALGLYVVSNPSAGMKAVFGEHISFTGEPIPNKEKRKQAILHNLDYVIRNHSYQSRLRQIAWDIGLQIEKEQPVIFQTEQLPDVLPECDYIYIGQTDQQRLLDAAVHFEYLPPDTGILLIGDGEHFVRQPYVGDGKGMLFDARSRKVPEFAVRI